MSRARGPRSRGGAAREGKRGGRGRKQQRGGCAQQQQGRAAAGKDLWPHAKAHGSEREASVATEGLAVVCRAF